VALYRTNSAFNVCDCLALGYFSDEDLAVFGKGHNRWSGAGTFGICDNRWLATF
jgi:hypothetical protein